MHLSVLFGAVVLGPLAVWAQCPQECHCEDTELGAKAKCSNLVEVFPPGKHNAFKILDISFNNVAILDDRVFQNNRLLELSALNISHNTLDKIHVNAFLLMTELKVLDLSHNDLSNIGSSALSPLFQNLEELYLNNNPLLVLSTRFGFGRLTVLDLSNCHQKTLPEKFLNDMKSLVHLSLAANDIETIEPNLAGASGLKNLSTLNLSGNKLTGLTSQLLVLRQDIQIDLSGNPWTCDCDLFDVIALYYQRKYSSTLTCVTPEEIAGQDATSFLAEERNCLVLRAGNGFMWTSLLAVGIISVLVLVFIGVTIRRRRKRRELRRQQDERNAWGLLYADKS